MPTLYGITNCDTVKKARAFLAEREVAYTFHDFKKQGVPIEALDRWLAVLGWEALLNRRGTTWRQLDAARQAEVADAASAKALMLEMPSVIRRPVVANGSELHVGFDAADWSRRYR
jgi:arsenate reductase (glutaredoxin)